MEPGRVVLASGRDGPFRGGHPWVFAGAVGRVEGVGDDGDEVAVLSADGGFVARGLFNGRSQIRVRLYAWEPVSLDRNFFRSRMEEAVRLRRDILDLGDSDGACRLVFSEADGLSGLTVDRYGPYVAVQFTSLALARRSGMILDLLDEVVAPRATMLRTEKGILEQEGLELRDGPLRGEVPDGPFEVTEGGLRFLVDLRQGHKTGFYLDQRENRRAALTYADGRSVADVCCYTGGFSIPLATRAKSVVGVDASEPALAMARRNAELNGVADRSRFVRGDAFQWLETAAGEARRFDMIVLDPPRFARTRKGVPQALRAYERLNRLALRCLSPDGILVTCSCSGRVSEEDFSSAVGRAAASAGRRVQVLERRGQAADHPVSATCPESSYLKCLICRVA